MDALTDFCIVFFPNDTGIQIAALSLNAAAYLRAVVSRLSPVEVNKFYNIQVAEADLITGSRLYGFRVETYG